MGGRVAHFIWNGQSIRYELGLDRVLYHGTSRRRAEAILREGLKPRVGEFLRSVYPRARLRPLVSAACEVCGSKVFSAARFAVAQELGRDRRTVTREEMLRHSAVVVIESERGNFRQASAMDRPQRGVEKCDYYSFEPVRVDRVLEGGKLAEFYGGLLDFCADSDSGT